MTAYAIPGVTNTVSRAFSTGGSRANAYRCFEQRDSARRSPSPTGVTGKGCPRGVPFLPGPYQLCVQTLLKPLCDASFGRSARWRKSPLVGSDLPHGTPGREGPSRIAGKACRPSRSPCRHEPNIAERSRGDHDVQDAGEARGRHVGVALGARAPTLVGLNRHDPGTARSPGLH